MLRVLLLSSGLVAVQDPVLPPAGNDRPAANAEAAEALALAEYNPIRDKTPETAAAHWKLALWCEQKGLKPEAHVHLNRLIELDPKRDAAWQRSRDFPRLKSLGGQSSRSSNNSATANRRPGRCGSAVISWSALKSCGFASGR
jgi:hypothetical protein